MIYIKYGWDKLLVDPDNGENCQRKLAAVSGISFDAKLFLILNMFIGIPGYIIYQRLPLAPSMIIW